jgi:hypothetical protein
MQTEPEREAKRRPHTVHRRWHHRYPNKARRH